MRIDEYELFRSGRAKALMDEAGFTTLLKRPLVTSESGPGERQFAPTCSVPSKSPALAGLFVTGLSKNHAV
jgi:hypothetical protein